MHTTYPWQQEQWQYLSARCNNGNLPHALLLTGQCGLGKTEFAQALAESLLCEQAASKPCGHCRSCLFIQANSHPDYKLIAPKDKIIQIEQIRDIVNTINKKAHQNQYKIVIINPAHAMNIAASNALLKTLEEPQGVTLIILISDHPSLLLPTIRSRCQTVGFSPPSKEIAKNWLAQQSPQADNLDLLLALAENAPLLALQLGQDNMLQQRADLFKDFTDLLQQKLDPIQFAEANMKMDLPIIIRYLQVWLADIIKIKQGSADEFLLNIDKIQELRTLSNTAGLNKLFKIIDQLTEFNRYTDNNLNKQLLLEDVGATLAVALKERKC